MKKVLLCVLVLVLFFCSFSGRCYAKTSYRYATRKVNLRNKVKGEVVYTVKRNTKLEHIKTGKVWVKVKYKDKVLVCKKKLLSKEGLPSKKRSKRYIKYIKTRGPVRWRGRKFTYYTSRALPIWKLPVPGLHLDKDGFFCDKNDYIVLGSSIANKRIKKVIATPFGKYGKVYDTGGYSTPSYLCDCATNW